MSTTIATLAPADMHTAKGNARKVAGLLAGTRAMAVLYRTTLAGPSGQRADTRVGRVYAVDGTDEYERPEYDLSVYVPGTYELAGYARYELHRDHGYVWAMFRESYDGDVRWIGYAETLPLGVDVCVNGLHAATGRHGTRRLSGGRFYAASTLSD